MSDSIELVNKLITTVNTNGARVCAQANIKSPNFYNWIGGKPNTLSEAAIDSIQSILGVENERLIVNKVHRWYRDNDDQDNNIADLIHHFTKPAHAEQSIIYQGRSSKNKRFSLLKLMIIDQPIYILCLNKNDKLDKPPVDTKYLGFGTEKNIATVPQQYYSLWNKSRLPLDQKAFIEHCNALFEGIDLSNINPVSDNNTRYADNRSLDTYEAEITELKATNAGLKAIIRKCLKEIRDTSPDNRLLEDSVRKEIFDDFYDNEKQKLTNPNALDF